MDDTPTVRALVQAGNNLELNAIQWGGVASTSFLETEFGPAHAGDQPQIGHGAHAFLLQLR